MDWNDLRTIAEVARQGTMGGAARALGLHATSVTRRIRAVEQRLDEPLFLRTGHRLTATPTGRRIIEALEPFVDPVDAVARRIAREALAPVRLATTESYARLVLVEIVPRLPATHILDVLADNRTVDLTRGEADLALRVVPPTHPSLVAKRVGRVHIGLFASARYLEAHGEPESWRGHRVLVPSGRLAGSDEARFLATEARQATVVARCSSHVALAGACAAGIGLAALPACVAHLHGLVEVRSLDDVLPERHSWLVYHEDARQSPRNRVVIDALVAGLPRALGRRS